MPSRIPSLPCSKHPAPASPWPNLQKQAVQALTKLSDHITPSEARALYRRDRDIEIRESRFKSYGSATSQERQQLRSELDGLGAEVERMMANRDIVQPAGHTNTPGIDNRQLDLRARINEGVRSGDLTQRQARRLQSRERDISRHEASYKRDGVVTQQERRQLRDELARLNADLDRMTRNLRHTQH